MICVLCLTVTGWSCTCHFNACSISHGSISIRHAKASAWKRIIQHTTPVDSKLATDLFVYI
uniref:Uncharacterized protein n=1 Tax=Anguilla anguilla TaxID=7936 RepID=A0A0E9SJH1_ANGAN